MTEIDNSLLEKFFEPARQLHIDDEGFTEKVMRQLPDRAMCLSHWWTFFCAVFGIVLFFVFEGWQPLLISVVKMVYTFSWNDIHPIPCFMALGVITCLALLELVHRMERMQV